MSKKSKPDKQNASGDETSGDKTSGNETSVTQAGPAGQTASVGQAGPLVPPGVVSSRHGHGPPGPSPSAVSPMDRLCHLLKLSSDVAIEDVMESACGEIEHLRQGRPESTFEPERTGAAMLGRE